MSAYVEEICRMITLLLPLLVPGIVLIVILKLKLLKVLDIPLDLGLSIRGKRIFGDNKTYKGVVVMLFGGIATTYALYFAYHNGFSHLMDTIFMKAPLLIGGLYACSYILGELINSFIKRQLNIPEGVVLPSTYGKVQTFFDLSDGVIITVLMLNIFTSVPTTRLLTACFTGILLHYCTDLWMKKLRLK